MPAPHLGQARRTPLHQPFPADAEQPTIVDIVPGSNAKACGDETADQQRDQIKGHVLATAIAIYATRERLYEQWANAFARVQEHDPLVRVMPKAIESIFVRAERTIESADRINKNQIAGASFAAAAMRWKQTALENLSSVDKTLQQAEDALVAHLASHQVAPALPAAKEFLPGDNAKEGERTRVIAEHLKLASAIGKVEKRMDVLWNDLLAKYHNHQRDALTLPGDVKDAVRAAQLRRKELLGRATLNLRNVAQATYGEGAATHAAAGLEQVSELNRLCDVAEQSLHNYLFAKFESYRALAEEDEEEAAFEALRRPTVQVRVEAPKEPKVRVAVPNDSGKRRVFVPDAAEESRAGNSRAHGPAKSSKANKRRKRGKK